MFRIIVVVVLSKLLGRNHEAGGLSTANCIVPPRARNVGLTPRTACKVSNFFATSVEVA